MSNSWLERATRAHQLKGILDEFLSGQISRDEVEASAREIGHRAAWRLSFLTTTIDSLVNATRTHRGEYILRRVDFESYARELHDGCDPFEAMPLMTIPQSAATAGCERHSSPWHRGWIDGIGWFGFASVGSPGTGRRLRLIWLDADLAAETLADAPRVAGVVVPSGTDLDDAARDAIETFELSDDEILEIHPDVRASTWPRFVVVRQDDHGNRYDIVESRSEVYARARLVQFESLGHKQTYSLEQREPGPFVRPVAVRYL